MVSPVCNDMEMSLLLILSSDINSFIVYNICWSRVLVVCGLYVGSYMIATVSVWNEKSQLRTAV